jgi:dipeptidyl-peptidase-4
MRKFTTILIAVLMAGPILAQHKTFELEEIAGNRNLYPSGLWNLQWRGDTDMITWQTATALVGQYVSGRKPDTLLKAVTLNSILKPEKELKRLPFILWDDAQSLRFNIGTDYYVYNMTSGQATKTFTLPEKAENIEYSPETRFIAYTIDNNLYVNDGKIQKAVSSDENKGIVSGQSVHRNEFGINKGIFWSPKGNLLAFYRMDETMVAEYPLVDITGRIAEVNNFRYPMAGMTSHHVTLGVFNPANGEVVFMQTTGPADHYLTNIAWSPDEKSVFIAELNRDQNHLLLNKYDAATGKFVKTLFEEKNPRYVEPQHPLEFLPGDATHFVWQSQRDGFNHLYLYIEDGTLEKQLTSGNWVVTSLEGFSKDNKGIFYTSTATNPLEKQLYYLDIKSGKSQKLSKTSGSHQATISGNGKFIATTFSNPQIATQTDILDTKGYSMLTLNKDINPLKDYALGETSILTLKSDLGDDLYCRLIKPVDFDAKKKYPVIIYVYGGPHSQLVSGDWLNGAGLFMHYLAQKGYAVFTLDNHGTSNRGFEFESVIHRNLGVQEMADQLTGVNYLKSLNWVDTSRLAVDGWSYGGFMTLTLKLKNPGLFKVATAGGPVTDWKFYEVMYGERYMDTPEQNPEGYKNASLLNATDGLEGKLLIIHGAQDNTVVWQNSLEFLNKCIENKKQLDYFIYPTHEHNVRGLDRVHLYRKLATYYDDFL